VGELALITSAFLRAASRTSAGQLLLEPGTVTALVGFAGSGKSTIIGLVAAFHVPLEGRVLVTAWTWQPCAWIRYRTRLGVVLQESFLFDGTIRENGGLLRGRVRAKRIWPRAASPASTNSPNAFRRI